ncbi:hypothetical protein WAF17_18660 [Bernardetia sp. ABR2-2B]|uniref:hypothetical protein n=1 Tax=Bernardetia sp. ABR2-2B TaxID=3127472 RepID=UPI0030D04FA9
MKSIKLYVSLFLWVTFGIVMVAHFISDEDKELTAINNTNSFVAENNKLIWQEQLKKLRQTIANDGNNARDMKVYNDIRSSYDFIDGYYKNNEIAFKNVIEILPDSSKVVFKEEQKQEFVTTKSQIVKEIYKLNLHQNAYRSLYTEYMKIGSFGCHFSIISIIQESDSTLGFYGVGFPLEMDLSKQTAELVHNNSKQDYNWKLFFPKDSLKPITFQINTYTKTDTIRKRYQIKPQKGKKLKPFEYEEIK